jgi:hypothetical protein
VATWSANNLTIQGTGNGRARIDMTGLAIPNRTRIPICLSGGFSSLVFFTGG